MWVVSCSSIEKKLEKAGLPVTPHDQLTEWLNRSGVEVRSFFAYLSALENGAPIDDQSISNCPSDQANKITQLFKSRGHIIAK